MHNRFVCLLLALCLLLPLAAVAEGAAPGDLPRRGIILPLTQADMDSGLSIELTTLNTTVDAHMPAIDFLYTDAQLVNDLMAQQPAAAEDPALAEQIRKACSGPAGQLLLIRKDAYEQMTGGGTIADALGVPTAFPIGENEGYVYVGLDYSTLLSSSDTELLARATAAAARAAEIMAGAQFQPLVFDADEFYKPQGQFPAFTTTDLEGNTVTEAIFADKALTVVNVWGTFCGPCIEEMDELAAWSQSMPENVQLIGLVSDLYSPEDTDTFETAVAICEATGANVYKSLVASDDLAPLLSQVVGVPTTFFVNANGEIIGEPIVGANVPGCMAFVEEYLNAQ